MKGVYFKPKIKYLFALITFEGQQLTRGCGYRVGSPSPFITLPFSPQHRSQTFSSPFAGGKIKSEKWKNQRIRQIICTRQKKRPDHLIIAGAHCVCRWSAIERRERKRWHTNCSQVDKSLKYSIYTLNHLTAFLIPQQFPPFPAQILIFYKSGLRK